MNSNATPPAEDGVSRPIQTIVVATDFSEAADNAVARACEIARSHDAQLVVAHSMTLQLPPAGGPRLMNLPADFENKVREASLEALEKVADRVRDEGIDTVAEMTVGPPARSLVGIAEDRKADLIVIGTRGVTGVAHLLLGSTAEHLIQQARCPVISVHPADAGPLDAVGRVLVPTDFSEDASLAATVLTDLLAHRTGQVSITLVHAYSLPAGVSQLLGYYPVATDLEGNADAEVYAALEPQAEALRARGFVVEVIASNGYAPDVITALARTLDVDLIAMGTRGISGLEGALRGSTAKRVVQHASCPVLTVGRSRH